MRRAAAEAEQFQRVGLELDFDADEPAKPMRCGEIGMAQDVEMAAVVGAAKVDETAVRERLQVERPRLGKSPTQRSIQCQFVDGVALRRRCIGGNDRKGRRGSCAESEARPSFAKVR